MDSQKKVRLLLAASGAGFPPQNAVGGGDDAGMPGDEEGGKRNIPATFEYNPKALKPLARMLLSMSISLGHALTAYREFTKLKSSNISPDGKVGGRGYVLGVKDVRAKLQEACELISAVSDTVYDEINAPHWKPKLADLGKNEAEDITEFLEESKKIMDDPEGYADEELDEHEEKNDGPGGTSDSEKNTGDPRFSTPGGASAVPGGGDPEVQSYKQDIATRPKMASTLEGRLVARFLKGNSSLPVNTLPGGPRVDHLDRGEQLGPWGSYNTDEPKPVGDEWGKSEGVGQNYAYPSDSRMSDSVLPSDDTPTEADDFGLGYGAKGQGSKGYGTKSPDGIGVAGPNALLPDDPGGKLTDNVGDSTPYVEHNHAPMLAAAPWGMSELPNDGEKPVSRSDYSRDDRGNQFNVNHNSESGLPGSGQSILPEDIDMSPNVTDTVQDQAVPYVKFDDDSLDGDRGNLFNVNHNSESEELSTQQNLLRNPNPPLSGVSGQPTLDYVAWDPETQSYRHAHQDFYSYDRTSDG